MTLHRRKMRSEQERAPQAGHGRGLSAAIKTHRRQDHAAGKVRKQQPHRQSRSETQQADGVTLLEPDAD